MRFYLDTEFIERGHEYPIELISIALVGDDGSHFYGSPRPHRRRWGERW